MAKAKVVCTCQICGTEFVKQKICSSRKEANSWEIWAERNYHLCPSCYRKEKIELDREEGIHYKAYLYVNGILNDCVDKDLIIIFENGYPFKDKLKELKIGAFWDPRVSVWKLYCSFDNYQGIIDKLNSIPGIKDAEPIKYDIDVYKKLREKKEKQMAVLNREMNAKLEEINEIWKQNKVALPNNIAKRLADGERWNGKFYGCEGNWAIYLNDERVKLTNAERDALIMETKNETDYKNNKSQITLEFKQKKEKLNAEILKDIEETSACSWINWYYY